MRPKLISQLKAHNKAMKAAGMKKRFIVAGHNLTLPHGLLGQSWSTAKYDNQWKYIEGDVNEYSVRTAFSARNLYIIDMKYKQRGCIIHTVVCAAHLDCEFDVGRCGVGERIE